MPGLGKRGSGEGAHKLEPDLEAPMPSGHQELPRVFWKWWQWVFLDHRALVSAELLVGCDSSGCTPGVRGREAKKNSRQFGFGVTLTEQRAAWRVWKKTVIPLGLPLICPCFSEHGKGLLLHTMWPEAGLTVVFLVNSFRHLYFNTYSPILQFLLFSISVGIP